jgi:hypothetical protein
MLAALCAGLQFFGLQSLIVSHCGPQAGLVYQISLAANVANYSEPWRPQLHYTEQHSWLNDPNGLFKDEDGLWHIYYQCKY